MKLYASGGRGVPRRLQKLWDVVARTPWRIDDWSARSVGWWDASIELLAIADSAAVGMGFTTLDPQTYPFAGRVALAHYRSLNGMEDPVAVPHTLCIQVPTSEVAVQPKTRTPQTGCTLRGLSHNLALVPRDSEAMTGWFLGRSFEAGNAEPLNLLIVPFPFRVRGGCFEGDRSSGSFSVNQEWLRSGRRAIDANSVIGFLRSLIRSARREVSRVHAIVLPELALDKGLAEAIAAYLAKRTDLEFFITGILDRRKGTTAFPTNAAYTALFFDRASRMSWIQRKHHRWRLDRSQICRYQLGNALDPTERWWEAIDVQSRAVAFYVFRQGASLATLICEDLARIDPVQHVVRAIGANLVVALLMDGPQLETRWPARYATILADDPGCSVLTVTSLGLVERSVAPGEAKPRQIALWKDPTGGARELILPEGDHALLLTVSQGSEKQYTLDGRDDDGMTVSLFLSAVRSLTCPRPPKWLNG